MTTNNKEKIPLVSIIMVALIFLGIAYLLYQTYPKNVNQVYKGGREDNGVSLLLDKPLPNIELKDKNGKIYSSKDFKGKYTVLFFNEGLMCYPGCWNQVASFGNDDRFNASDTQAISVVVDSPHDWQKAIDRMPALSKSMMMFDEGANASKMLGMLDTRSSMHRGMLPGHTYILLDKEAIVRYVFDDPSMSIANDTLWQKIKELTK